MSRPMLRVLHVLNTLQRSGAEVMLAAGAPHFRAAGFDGHILSTGEEPGPFAETLSHAGYVIHHLPFSRSAGFFSDFRRLVAATRPDVVHIHTERAALAYAALARPTATVIRTIHACFEFSGALRWRKAGERWLSRRAFGAVHVAPSPSVRDNEHRRFMNETVLCPNWYDDRRFFPPTDEQRRRARDALAYTSDDVVVACIGNHEPVKNFAVGLEAFARVRPDRRLRFLHVGCATAPETGDSLPQLAVSLGVSDRTRFIGPTDDVPRYLHAADVCLVPSLREGFSVATVEAMASGLPLILADVPGLADFRDGIPGLVYSAPSINDLTRAITSMAEAGESARRQLGARIAAAASERFSTEAGVVRYVALYRGAGI